MPAKRGGAAEPATATEATAEAATRAEAAAEAAAAACEGEREAVLADLEDRALEFEPVVHGWGTRLNEAMSALRAL